MHYLKLNNRFLFLNTISLLSKALIKSQSTVVHKLTEFCIFSTLRERERERVIQTVAAGGAFSGGRSRGRCVSVLTTSRWSSCFPSFSVVSQSFPLHCDVVTTRPNNSVTPCYKWHIWSFGTNSQFYPHRPANIGRITHALLAELWPVCQTGNSGETDAKTREFLKRVVEILLDHITVQNDRAVKILDFHSVSWWSSALTAWWQGLDIFSQINWRKLWTSEFLRSLSTSTSFWWTAKTLSSTKSKQVRRLRIWRWNERLWRKQVDPLLANISWLLFTGEN